MRKPTIVIAAIITAALVLTAGGCTGDDKSAQSQGQAQTEQAFGQQSSAVPYPADQLKDSLERRNLKDRLLRTNNPSAIGYLYLQSFGKVLGYYVIKGKVSSTQSQMTTDNLVVDRCSNSTCPVVVNAPGDDGSYGANEPGIFFFTTEGAMVTTNLDYILSDQPIPFDVPKLNKGN
jgi:hypothetical protein